MKKSVLFATIMMFAALLFAQQDTIIGFTFPNETDTEFNANLGLDGNLSYDIRAESDSDQTVGMLTYTSGVEDFAATSDNWDNGMDDKFWSIKFKADGYTNLNVSSKQYSDNTKPGPKDWKLQARLSGGEWEDITNGTVTVANDWTTGVVSDLNLSSTFDNPGTTSVYIRWIMTSNTSIADVDVLADGISKIDDIVVKGTNSTGIESEILFAQTSIYPNPCVNNFHIQSTEEIKQIELYNMQGSVLSSKINNELSTDVSVEGLSAGFYFVKVFFNNELPIVKRMIIE